jgi:hypothetical protein
MMPAAPALVLVWALAAQARPAPADDLAAVKALYAAASYEEALTRLSALHGAATADEADEYRALCLLALGRTADAERALEVLVGRNPLFKVSEAEVSPRLVELFHAVRHRLLPDTARNLYRDARASMNEKRYDDASAELTRLLAILDDADAEGDETDLADLKLLAQGFLDLANTERAKAAAAAAEARATREAADKAAADKAALAAHIYTEADRDVTPPVDVAREFPTWRPPNLVEQRQRHSGIIRVLIDEEGRVVSAAMVEPVAESYDPILLAAAKDWKFEPARRNGEPVKYVKLITVVLSAR